MGGVAFKDKVRRILKEEIPETLQYVSSLTAIDKSYLSKNMLGSAGKSDTSGDIDLNMDERLYDKVGLLAVLKEKLGEDNVKDWTHVNQIFTCVPIKGDPANGFIQIDFMFGDRAWQEFSYFSPGPKSKYKGLFRTELLKAAVAFNSDWVLKSGDDVIARVGPTFFHDRGCVWRYRHRPMRKDLTGRVKAFVELTEEEFLKLYPYAEPATQSVVDTSQGVSDIIFGNGRHNYGHTAAFESYETLKFAIKTRYNFIDYGIVMQIFHERLNSLKVDIPEDIENEILAATGAIG